METKGALRCPIMASFSSSGFGKGRASYYMEISVVNHLKRWGVGGFLDEAVADVSSTVGKTKLPPRPGLVDMKNWSSGHFSMTNQYTLSISGVNQLTLTGFLEACLHIIKPSERCFFQQQL